MLKIVFYLVTGAASDVLAGEPADRTEKGTTGMFIKQMLFIWTPGRASFSAALRFIEFEFAVCNQIKPSNPNPLQTDKSKRRTMESPGKPVQNCTEIRLKPGIEPET